MATTRFALDADVYGHLCALEGYVVTVEVSSGVTIAGVVHAVDSHTVVLDRWDQALGTGRVSSSPWHSVTSWP